MKPLGDQGVVRGDIFIHLYMSKTGYMAVLGLGALVTRMKII